MNDTERKVLHSLSDAGLNWCLPFAPICREWGIDRKAVRRACRSLARKGFARFQRGLWSDDGEPAGAGYCITDTGKAAFQRVINEQSKT